MASVAAMFPGRLTSVALGGGEALNEHLTGQRWPAKPERMARLRECVDVMGALWRGEEVSHSGQCCGERPFGVVRRYSQQHTMKLAAAAQQLTTTHALPGWDTEDPAG